MLRIFRYGAFSLSAAQIARFSHSLERWLFFYLGFDGKDQKIAAFGSSYMEPVHQQEIGRLTGRLRGQASLLQKTEAARHAPPCSSPLIRPSVSSPVFDLALPAPSA